MSHPPPPSAGLQMHLSQQQSAPSGGGNMMMDTCSEAAGGGSVIGSNGINSNSAADASPSTIKMSTVVVAEVKGNLQTFSLMGQNAATWKPMEGKHASIFGIEDTIGMSVAAEDGISGGNMMLHADLANATNSLRNVTITSARVEQVMISVLLARRPGT